MNSTIRVSWGCLPPTIHYRRLATGTQWLGHGPNLLGDIEDRLPGYEIIPDEHGSPKPTLLMEDKANICPMMFGYTHQRYQERKRVG